MKDIAKRLASINAAVAEGETPAAQDLLAHLIGAVSDQELRAIAAGGTRPSDGLEAAFDSLSSLVTRLGGALEVTDVNGDSVDFAAVRNPLSSLTCIRMSPDDVEQVAIPSVSDTIGNLYPGLVLEPHPSLRANEYRLRRV